MSNQAEEIRRRMSEVRREMDEDVDELVESAKSLVDWRSYVTSRPLASLAVAAAVGFVLVPKKQVVRTVDASQLSGALSGKKVVLANDAEVKQKSSFMTGAITALATTAMRTATANLGQHFAAALSTKVQNDNSEKNRSSSVNGTHFK